MSFFDITSLGDQIIDVVCRWVALTLPSGSDGTSKTVPTTTAGSGSHVGLDVNVISESGGASAVASIAAKTVPTVTATALAAQAAAEGVLVCADLANAGVVYIGGSGVTISTGLPLRAGDSTFITCSNSNLLYCISASAAQVLRAVVL